MAMGDKMTEYLADQRGISPEIANTTYVAPEAHSLAQTAPIGDATPSDDSAAGLFALGAVRASDSAAPRINPGGPESEPTPETELLNNPSIRIHNDIEPSEDWTPGGPKR